MNRVRYSGKTVYTIEIEPVMSQVDLSSATPESLGRYGRALWLAADKLSGQLAVTDRNYLLSLTEGTEPSRKARLPIVDNLDALVALSEVMEGRADVPLDKKVVLLVDDGSRMLLGYENHRMRLYQG